MKVTKFLAFVMAFAMVVSLLPVAGAAKTFERTNNWENGEFSDVPGEEWFASNVKDAFELGLMKGAGNNKFNPKGNISLAETITVAARIHSLATAGEENFAQGNPWYQVYADYALANGIISSIPANITSNATRLQFAEILAKAMSDEDLSAINTVDDGIIPDVASNASVYKLYRAGVLTGSDDKGTFSPANSISRAEVSAIVARMALPETRIKRDLKKTVAKTEEKKTTNVSSMAGGGSSSGSKPQKPQEPPKSEISATVEVDDEGKVKNEVSMSGDKVNAVVPAGVAVNEGAEKLTLKVEEMEETGGNIELGEDETLSSYDVHIDGISSENTVAIKVFLGEILPAGMNLGNIALYHIENEETNAMTQVSTLDELDEHNEFYYDPATGNVTVALASFSEIAVVAEPPKWNGNRDYSWYRSANETNYTIANADQLAGLSAIVGGMDGQTADSFVGKTIKMVCDIAINDTIDSETDEIVFYPIGYYNSEGTYAKDPNATTGVTSGFRNFEGTFDGNGHTISNFYQNTWEMKGDHDWYDANLQYYRDGMGVFGKVYKGTVKNLTVDNFSSDGEITTTGVIAAYADGATFENIAIFNCNPRVYNIGNGGIVGCVGWYAKEADLKTTFKNITVDNSNKISALWGSWDVACGGLVGQYYPTSGQTSAGTPKNGGIRMENCHVSAQMDVYNDVCANYQYYAYRYAGILIGSVRENVTIDGHSYPKMDGITASGCTVHFGDWNDYYYCELVANSLASYTHDHQMSRLEQVANVEGTTITYLDGTTGTVPASGAANYVVVKAKKDNGEWDHGDGHDYAECYHFVNGEVWNHEDAGTETVDGVEVLKEDKQCIYREFNNLVTGYGWGVTSKGVGDLTGVTILDREDASSVIKFKGKGVISEVESGTEIRIGELFDFVNNGVELKPEGLTVTVGDPNEADGIASGTFNKAANWADSTITIHGKGAISITIQDYYFCIPTTITLTAIDPMMTLDVDATMLYAVGQELNFNSVTVEYASGDSKILNADEYTVSDVDMSFGGKKIVTVTYTELGKTISAELLINVADSFNALIASPKKRVYNIGDTVKKTDFVVNAVTEDGSKGEISDFSINAVDTSAVGVKTVTISFTNPNSGKIISTQCQIEVMNLVHVTGNNVPTVKYWHAGNFAASNNWNHVEQPGTGYESFVGKTYTGANGEVVTGFNLTGHTAAQPMSGYNNLVVKNAKPYSLIGINGTIGFEGATVKSMGYYVDGDLSTVKNDGILSDAGNGNTAYIVQANLYDFAPGSTHTITYVVETDAGFIDLCQWTITMASASNDAFVDTDKPNVNVIIIAGQSNACGASPITQSLKNQYSNVNYQNVYMQYKNTWVEGNNIYTACESSAFEKYYYGMGGFQAQHFGPEAGLAYYLATDENTKNEQWFIIKYAATGTTITQWNDGVQLANELNDYVKSCIAPLTEQYDVQIRSLLWMQGETDAAAEGWANAYKENEQKLVSNIRTALATYATRTIASVAGSGISFIDAGIAPNSLVGQQTNGLVGNFVDDGGRNDWKWSATVNWAKFENGERWYLPNVTGGGSVFGGNIAAGWYYTNQGTPGIINSAYIDTYTLLSKNEASDVEKAEYVVESDKTDWAHYSSESMVKLGQWFGEALVYVMGKDSTTSSGSSSSTTTYTVTYKANGGNAVTPETVVVAENCPIVLLPATREGYTFNGWYTAATGGTKVGDAGASYTPEKDITLYAQWTEGKKYTITYNANSGSVTPSSVTVYEGDSVTLPTPTRNNYTFNGWYTAANGGTKIGDAGASYTPENDITLYAQWTEDGCFTPETLITLADGTQKRIDEITFEDKILAWDFFKSEYVERDISLLVNHGTNLYKVANSVFSDGTVLRTIADHGIFDYDLNQFIYITPENAEEFIGHRFVKSNTNGSYDIVTLENAYVTEEYTTAYSITSAYNSNAFAEGILTVAPPEDFYNWIEMGDLLTYDVEKFNADVEKYGLYTYEDFADYVTYEQFIAFNGEYLKIPVEKGLITFDYILGLIDLYISYMPQ